MIPYEIKTCTFKNALGVFMGEVFEFMVPFQVVGPAVIAIFAFNWFYRMSLYARRMVVEVELQSNGTRATFTTLMGQ